MSFARPDPSSPSSVADAGFGTARRGFDQTEVRDFLRMVAAELGRLQERERFLERELRSAQTNPDLDSVRFDDDTITRLLGEETARVLLTARESASEIREKAERSASQMLSEAAAEAGRLREEAEVEASRRRSDAGADAEAELAMAKQQGREMVNEARAYRERVLSELARRRELAREQIEQLLHGRQRLLQSFEQARIVAVDVMAELQPLGEPDEYVNLAPTTGPVPVMVPNASRPTIVDADGGPVTEDVRIVPRTAGPTPGSAATLTPATGELGESSSGDGADRGVDNLVMYDGAEDEIPADEIPAVDGAEHEQADGLEMDVATAGESSTEGTVATGGAAAEESTPDDQTEDANARVDADAEDVVASVDDDADEFANKGSASAAADHDVADEVPETAANILDDAQVDVRDDVVVDLFARIRADAHKDPETEPAIGAAPEETDGDNAGDNVVADTAADSGADDRTDAVPDAEPEPEPEVEAAVEAEVEATVFEQRDADLTPLIVAGARKLKRVLADEQNEVLDALRRSEPVRDIETLLPVQRDQREKYNEAINDDLAAAASAGAALVLTGRRTKLRKAESAKATRAACDVLDEWLVTPLRERLERAVADGDGDNAEITKRVRAVYRECKTQHIDEQLDDVLRMAHGRGLLGAVETGTSVAWVADDAHPACADCDDNTLAGAVEAGHPFPTGHTFAPAHIGCRCLLVPIRQ